MLKTKLKNQKGFTLIEIIAVLVILGILAAVAVPKYMDMQDEARIASAKAAISEVQARYSSAYGAYLLKNNGINPTTVVSILSDAEATDVGADFTVGVSGTSGTRATITVSAVQSTTITGTQPTGGWSIPTTYAP